MWILSLVKRILTAHQTNYVQTLCTSNENAGVTVLATSNKDQVRQKLVELRNELCLHYSEFNSRFFKLFRVICHIHVNGLLRLAMVQYSKILLCLKSSERHILDSKNFLLE